MSGKGRTGSRLAARFFFCFFSCFVSCWTLVFCLPAPAQEAEPERDSGWQLHAAAVGRRAMVASANHLATEAALEILALGGNAIDAAIAAQFVLNLVEPQSSGIGGGGFLLYYDAAARRVTAYDGRETAPAAARPDRFSGADGAPLAWREALAGGRSIGVPGLVALLGLVHQRHASLRWERLLRPALRLAEEGFPVSPRLHRLLQSDPLLRGDVAARRLYYGEDGAALAVGAPLKNPQLAGTLRRLADSGAAAFYAPDMARAIAAAVASRRDGDLSEADLRGYRAQVRRPVCARYRGYRVCGMPPPSSGGVSLLQILGILEHRRFAQLPPLSPPAVHDFAEAGRLAYADRQHYLADPDFVAVPVQQLLDPDYLDRRASLIVDGRSMGRAVAGVVPGAARGENSSPERPGTTHLSIVDAAGNAVALTSSIESAFGSRLMVGGFLLNNQLTDFSFLPGRDGRLVANRVEAGKRPLSSMAPTLVFDRRDRLYAVLGSAGGTRIINDVAQTLTALIDWRLAADAAVALPHYGSRNGPTELEQGRLPPAMADALRDWGHRIEWLEMNSGVHLIVRQGDHWTGAADPRREGSARGY